MPSSETLTNCPFCSKMTITILHIPLVINKFVNRGRSGGTRTRKNEEKYNVLSGCEECGKSKKEVEKELNEGKQIPHEEKLKRAKESGMPTILETPVPDKDEWDEE
ncbi:MAG: hypothetical protein ABH873_07950 [Candidatus Firestonebacteria bacterium]